MIIQSLLGPNQENEKISGYLGFMGFEKWKGRISSNKHNCNSVVTTTTAVTV